MDADDIFQSLAKAEQNYRYWSCVVERLYRRRKYTDFAIALCSSSVPITIGVLEKASYIWKALSCISAFVSIWAASFNLKEELKAATELKGRWYQLLVEYQSLWEDAKDEGEALPPSFKIAFQKLRKRQADLEPLEPGIPHDKKLADRCYEEVCQTYGLKPFSEEASNPTNSSYASQKTYEERSQQSIQEGSSQESSKEGSY